MEATPGSWEFLAGAVGACVCHATGSYFIEDHGEIHVDSGGIQLHDALRNQILVYPPQLGSLLPILGDDCLLVEFVSQVPIFIIEHGAAQRRRQAGLEPQTPQRSMLNPKRRGTMLISMEEQDA